MKTAIKIRQEYSTVPGYFRVEVSWRTGRKLRLVSSGVIGPHTPPEALAEELRGLGWRILESASRHPLSK